MAQNKSRPRNRVSGSGAKGITNHDGNANTKPTSLEQGRGPRYLHGTMVDNPTALRLALKRAGYAPIPLNGKAPMLSGWQNLLVVPDETIANWGNGNTGILTKHTPGFDIDIRWPPAAGAVEALVRARFGSRGKILVRVGQPPKRLIPFRTDVPFKKIIRTFTPRDRDPNPRLEWLADGQQFVAAGLHPELRMPYSWEPPLWVWDYDADRPEQTVTRDELPLITEEEAVALIEDCARLLVSEHSFQLHGGSNGERAQRQRVNTPVVVPVHSDLHDDRATKQPLTARSAGDIRALRYALRCIDADPYENWYKVAPALRNGLGDELGWPLFEWWSRFSNKFKLRECQRKWRDAAQLTSIGIGTIYHLAGENNWEPVYPDDTAQTADTTDDDTVVGVVSGVEDAQTTNTTQPSPNQQQPTANTSQQPTDEHGVPLVPLSFADWKRRVLPEPVFLCGKWLTTTSRTLVTAETGIGKSMWATGLGIAMGAAKPFLRWQCPQQCNVLLVDGEVARHTTKERLIEESNRLGCDPAGMYTVNHEDLEGEWAPLNTEQGQKLIERQIKLIGRVDCIIFDNIISLISGDQKDEEGWAQVMQWVRKLTSRNIAQIWLHHTGHDTSRSYGTKTREWQMNNVIHFTKVEGQGDDGICFDMVFKKHRDKKPATRDDFADMRVSLVDDQWVWSVTDQQLRPLGPTQQKFYEALCVATAQSETNYSGHPSATQDAWRAVCLSRGLYDQHQRTAFPRARLRLIEAGWVACNDAIAWTIGPNERAIF